MTDRGKARRPGTRGGRGTGAGRSPAPAPERATSLRHRGVWIAALTVVTLGLVVAAAVVFGGTGDDRAAELQAQEEAREAEQIVELNDVAIAVQAELLPVLDGLNAVLPVDPSAPARPGSSEDVASWRSAVDGAVATFGDPPSASTGVNLARNGLLLSVELLGSAVTAYESSLAAAGAERTALENLAADLRMQAVDAWGVAATHLDVLNIDAGHGHVHIYLPARPGEEMEAPHGH